jgi:hypothetical protein
MWTEFNRFERNRFSAANLFATCFVGESTEENLQSHIEEKGIGFASSFKVAENVLLQSDPYSFSFKYTSENNDIEPGMVIPISWDHLYISNCT